MLTHKELLKFAAAAYAENEVDFEKQLEIKGKTEAYYGDSLRKYITELDDCFVISFRGSVSKIDWIQNLTAIPIDVAHVNLSEGPYSELNSEINPRLSFTKPVYLTGHSLGGNLSLLEAFFLTEHNIEIAESVTFGAPMSGSNSFKETVEELLKDKVTNYICGDDQVPNLPSFGYAKTGTQINIGKKRSWFNPLKYYYIFKDHTILRYQEEMEKL